LPSLIDNDDELISLAELLTSERASFIKHGRSPTNINRFFRNIAREFVE